MTMHHLGRQAGRIAGDAVLRAVIHRLVRLRRDQRLIAQLMEEFHPERQQIIHVEHQRDTDLLLMMIAAAIAAQQIVLHLVQVRKRFLFRTGAQRRLFAFIAGDQPLSVCEHIDGQRAMVRAAIADSARRRMGEAVHLFLVQDRGGPLGMTLGDQRRAIGPHQMRDAGADDLRAQLLLEAAQHAVIAERAALYDDLLADVLAAAGTDDLIQRVLHDAAAKACRNVLDARAVFLRLLDAGVHEHRAARAQVDRVARLQAQLRKLLRAVAQALRKRLQKRSAA